MFFVFSSTNINLSLQRWNTPLNPYSYESESFHYFVFRACLRIRNPYHEGHAKRHSTDKRHLLGCRKRPFNVSRHPRAHDSNATLSGKNGWRFLERSSFHGDISFPHAAVRVIQWIFCSQKHFKTFGQSYSPIPDAARSSLRRGRHLVYMHFLS